MDTCPREGVVKEEKFPNTRKPSHWWVCGEFWNLRRQHNCEGKNKKNKKQNKKNNPQITLLTATPSREVAWALAEQVGAGCVLRVRTGPEYPEDNLREPMWESNPNCGIAREKRKKRDRENFPAKSSNLRHCRACSQNKGLSKYPLPNQRQGGRRATVRASKGQSQPQRWHPLPNCKQTPSC